MKRISPVAAVIASVAFSLAPTHEAPAQSFVNFETPHVSPIAITPSGATLLVCNTPDNRLEVFNVAGKGDPIHVRSISVGLDPVSVRARSETEAWVINHLSDSISIVDLPSGRVTATIGTGDEPCDVVFTNGRAFVTVSQLNQVRVWNLANLAAAPTILNIQGEDPRALAVSPNGATVYAAIFESGNKSTNLPRQAVGNPTGPYGGQNPPPNFGNVFDPPLTPGLPPAPSVAQIVKQNAAGQWMDDNNRNWSSFVTWGLHDHDVAIIDANTLAVTYASGLMNMVAGLAVSPSGVVTVVGTDAINEVRFESNINGIFVRCEIGSFNAGAPANVSVADLNPHLDYQSSSIPANERAESLGDPRGIAWLPDGTKAYVSGLGSNNVIVTNAGGARLGRIDVGQGPTGMAVSPDGGRLFVLNKFDGSVSVIDTSSDSVQSEVSMFDPTPLQVRLGRPFLYDTHNTSGLGQASCASCHIDGRTDHLGWDLGSPDGTVIVFNQICQAPVGGCIDWHPMKGPMVTQTLQGIIGHEPFHWRGEKDSLAEFNPAYTGLQGRDSEITALEMAQLADFVGSIQYPPNPNRNLDNTLRNTLAVTGGNGNPQTGRNLYINAPLLAGNLTCNACHALPDGSNERVDIPGADPQNRKNAQLRNMHEKTGFDRTQAQNNRGFGFDHAGTEDTIITLLSVPGFQFPPGATGAQQRRDIEAFLMSFSVDTHAGVGAQTTVADGANVPAGQQALLNQMITMAQGNAVGLVVKGRVGGLDRGYALTGATFQSDRLAEVLSPAALQALAATGSELTYTLVPEGSENRIGLDRDQDGFFDRNELDVCSDPANAAVTPGNVCVADVAVSGIVDVSDLLAVIAQWGATGNAPADIAPGCGNGVVNVEDLLAVIGSWGGCP